MGVVSQLQLHQIWWLVGEASVLRLQLVTGASSVRWWPSVEHASRARVAPGSASSIGWRAGDEPSCQVIVSLACQNVQIRDPRMSSLRCTLCRELCPCGGRHVAQFALAEYVKS